MNLNRKTKWQDLSIDQIKESIISIKKDIILMQINAKTQQKIKPHEIKQKKHELAQLLTIRTLKSKL